MWSLLAYYAVILADRYAFAVTFREKTEALAALAALLARLGEEKAEALAVKAAEFVADAELLDAALTDWRRELLEANTTGMPRALRAKLRDLTTAVNALAAEVFARLDRHLRGVTPLGVERG